MRAKRHKRDQEPLDSALLQAATVIQAAAETLLPPSASNAAPPAPRARSAHVISSVNGRKVLLRRRGDAVTICVKPLRAKSPEALAVRRQCDALYPKRTSTKIEVKELELADPTFRTQRELFPNTPAGRMKLGSATKGQVAHLRHMAYYDVKVMLLPHFDGRTPTWAEIERELAQKGQELIGWPDGFLRQSVGRPKWMKWSEMQKETAIELLFRVWYGQLRVQSRQLGVSEGAEQAIP